MSNGGPIIPHDGEITQVKDSSPPSESNLGLEKVIVERIPLYEEDFDVFKETESTHMYLEKRWVNSTKKIEVPVKYEEMFINGREFDSYSHNEISGVLSKVKEKISEVLHNDQNNEKKEGDVGENGSTRQYPHDLEIKRLKDEQKSTNSSTYNSEHEQKDSEKALALKSSETSTNTNQIQVSRENNYIDGVKEEEEGDVGEEQIIPIWGEQIIINKKIIKLGEIVIKKTKTLERRRLNVEVRKEKVTIKYPDGNKEEIL